LAVLSNWKRYAEPFKELFVTAQGPRPKRAENWNRKPRAESVLWDSAESPLHTSCRVCGAS